MNRILLSIAVLVIVYVAYPLSSLVPSPEVVKLAIGTLSDCIVKVSLLVYGVPSVASILADTVFVPVSLNTLENSVSCEKSLSDFEGA